ncbi:peptidase C1B, bleomycin hydrolase [Naematelia encephala]|uniref:Cysteine proteinase 1, mitochondrial n=1 Tax=Naematelia encephala TaxID=71784 RepID=A0A1Y2AL25_9TREE|nr:peptidase C1B, bleomycin hydrolase [Naematelia encephala]
MGSQASKATTTTSISKSSTTSTLDEKRAFQNEVEDRGVQAVTTGGTNDVHGNDGGAKDGFDQIGLENIDQWASGIESSPTLQLSRLVLSNVHPTKSLASRAALVKDAKVFNLQLKGIDGKGTYPGPRVNQASSGRCWLFATTNVLRYNVIETLKLGDFQLSQSYLFFYDKLEKANYYLESVLELVDEPLTGRLLSFLNTDPISDGGQWDMAVNIIEKYGIIPQMLYPESFSSSASSGLDTLLTSKLREYALILRSTANTKTHTLTSLRKLKAEMMTEVYSTIAITLGSPPKPDDKLTWEYYDAENKFHSWTGTPREFHDQFGKRKGMDPKDSFSLINDPRNEYEKLYTVERLGNVWGGRAVNYVNAPVTALEDAVIACIKANTPVFFGCDVGKSSTSTEGVMDCDLYDLKLAYGFTLGMNKAQRLEMGDSSMTHAMVITAVHLDEKGRPVRYKVENSWSESAGEKGWFMMTAPWFKEYVYQVVVPRSIADKKWSAVFDGGDAVVLKPWDPMGTLA